MKIIKYSLISIFTIYILLCLIVAVFSPKTIMICGEEININKPWRKPSEAERTTLSNLLKYNNIKYFNNMYVKDTEYGNLIIAFKGQNKKWDYGWTWPYGSGFERFGDDIKNDLPVPE